METTFTPLASTGGGVLIGVAAVILMLFLGRIAGATGILAGVLLPTNMSDWSWRAAFILGAIAAPLVAVVLSVPVQAIEVPVSTLAMVVGGLIVGCGVTLGSGCTSGHGVCGLSRLSARSLVATLVFMAATGITVFIVRHVIGG